MQMGKGSLGRDTKMMTMILTMCFLLVRLQGVVGIRFVIDREECLSHKVEYEGDNVHVSFVVIKTDSPWHYGEEGVDLLVISLYLLICILIN